MLKNNTRHKTQYTVLHGHKDSSVIDPSGQRDIYRPVNKQHTHIERDMLRIFKCPLSAASLGLEGVLIEDLNEKI